MDLGSFMCGMLVGSVVVGVLGTAVGIVLGNMSAQCRQWKDVVSEANRLVGTGETLVVTIGKPRDDDEDGGDAAEEMAPVMPNFHRN